MGKGCPPWNISGTGANLPLIPSKFIDKVTIDLAPLRKYKDFRNLWASGLVSYLGSMITFGLYGGVLADAVDRKKMLWASQAGLMVLTVVLLMNSLQKEPSLILIYVVIGLFAAFDGLQRPSAGAILPRIVGHHLEFQRFDRVHS